MSELCCHYFYVVLCNDVMCGEHEEWRVNKMDVVLLSRVVLTNSWQTPQGFCQVKQGDANFQFGLQK